MFRKARRLYRNIIHALNHEYEKELNSVYRALDDLKQENQLLHVLTYAYQHKKYQEEAEFLQNKKELQVFPYPIVKHLSKIDGGYDDSLMLPYVLHNDRRLYFSADMSVEEAKDKYRNYIEEENLLGGGYMMKAPHQYLSNTITIQDCDVLIDLGAAEGLLSLDVVDKVEHVVLVESELQWMKPLQATFAPYKDKVTIINKYVSDKNSDREISLQQLLEMFPDKRVMVKMDIEGQELPVLRGAREYIKERDGLTFLCCTYHRAGDEEEAQQLFEEVGYQIEISEGYILFDFYNTPLNPPYFRRGIIRAYRK